MEDHEEEDDSQVNVSFEVRETERKDNLDRVDFEEENDERVKKSQTSGPVDHVIYEEKSVLKKVRLEYVKSADSLEKADEEFVEPQGVVESTLYCECGDIFERWETAVEHIREFHS